MERKRQRERSKLRIGGGGRLSLDGRVNKCHIDSSKADCAKKN